MIATELPDLTTERTTVVPTPALPRRVRGPMTYPRLNPADRPDPASLAEERVAANGRRRTTPKRTATTVRAT